MHFVGKILVGLQVVLSILFMAFAGAVYTVQSTWKEEAEQLRGNYQQLQTELQQAQEASQQQATQAALDIKTQTDRADAAEAQNRFLSQQVTALTAERDDARQERDALMANAAINEREAEERRAEAIAQREVNKNLHQQRDNLRSQIEQLRGDLFGKDVEIRRMVDKHTTALDELALWRRAAQVVGLKPDPRELVGLQDPPPLVYGKVLDVKPDPQGSDYDYIEISLGADDGLIKGHELHVYTTKDRGKYLGKIRIVHTTADRAVAVLIDKTRNGRIERGDDVTTQL